jgi:hypothetical protein
MCVNTRFWEGETQKNLNSENRTQKTWTILLRTA